MIIVIAFTSTLMVIKRYSKKLVEGSKKISCETGGKNCREFSGNWAV